MASCYTDSMASQQNHNMTSTPSGNLKEFFHMVQRISADPSCQYLQEIVNNHSNLEARVQTLVAAKTEQEISMGNLHQHIREQGAESKIKDAEIENVREKAAKLEQKLGASEAQLQKKAGEAAGLVKNLKTAEIKMRSLEKELREEKGRVAETRQEADGMLAKLGQMDLKLRDVGAALTQTTASLHALERLTAPRITITKEQLTTRLNELYTAAFSLTVTYFTSPLPIDRLSNHALWTPLLNHQLNGEMKLKRAIPQPQTNTEAGRYMRAAACLAILGSTLVQRVLLPSYQFGSHELCAMMYDLAVSDPEKESHLRALLRGLASEEGLVAQAEERADDAADEVFAYVRGMVVDTEAEGKLKRDLKKVCLQAGKMALLLQGLEGHVHPSVEHSYDPEEWKVLSLPIAMEEAKASAVPLPLPGPTSEEIIGGSVGDRERPESAKDKKRRTGKPSSAPISPTSTTTTNGVPAAMSPLQTLTESVSFAPWSDFDSGVVWPSFMVLRGEEREVLLHGVVTGGQLAANAKRELNSTGPARQARQAGRDSRRYSVPVAVTAGSPDMRRVSLGRGDAVSKG